MYNRRPTLSRRRRSKRLLDDQFPASAESSCDTNVSTNQLGSFYADRPTLRLDASQIDKQKQHPDYDADDAKQTDHQETLENPTVAPFPAIQGTGQTHQATAYGQTLRLEGRTDANYDGGSFRTENVRVQRGADCESCGNPDCAHVTGTLVATYSVATTVTLPSVNDFPDLTPCQRTRVQNAITNILAPHERQHVAAFRQYNGTTRQQFDLTLCRSEFDSNIRTMFESEESTRRAAAQAASDALDPFHFDVDMNCEDRPSSRASGQQATDTNPTDTHNNL
jgi:hypothetical protein